jgi:SAM-dependent methyltransferase
VTRRWRAIAFTGVRAVAQALDAASRAAVYVGAGLLGVDDLRRVTTERWQEFGASDRFVDSGLLPWEAPFYARWLGRDDDVLVVGCGTGRDLVALLRAGHRAEGLEPAERAAVAARAALLARGFDAPVRIGYIEDAARDRAWDAIVFSWYCYSYIPFRSTRVATLRCARDRLAPRGRLLLSVITADEPPRRLPTALTALVARLSRAGWQPEPHDVLRTESRGLHWERRFVPGEVRSEASEAGLTVIHEENDVDGGRLVLGSA